MLGADITHYHYCTATAVFLAIFANFTIARADIFRWDNSQLIPGTEGITLGPGVQLNDMDLAFARLTRVNLTGANLSDANLANATFFGTNLKDANFSGANVLGTSFIGTANDHLGLTAQQLYSTASYQAKNLRGINLSAIPVWFSVESNLRGWDFSGQDLRGAYFGSAWLDDADFSNANLVDVQFSFGSFDSYRATLKNSNLTGADTRGATGLNLTGASTTNMIRPDGRIHGLDLKGGEKLVAYGGVAVPLRLDADLSIAADGTFDLTDNVAIVDYAGTRPAASIRQQIVSGRGGVGPGGKWTGMGITSSTAAAANAAQPDSRSLGYADNAAMPLGPYESFHGATVDATSILIAYTRTGDANLDGIVNDLDVTIVSAFYAPAVPQPAWALGDFDYNGFVDDDDVTLLGALYDPSAPPLNSQAAPGAAANLISGAQAVPEPSTALLALLVLIIVVAARSHARTRSWPVQFGLVAATAIIAPAASQADIFRWDDGHVVPGTEGITLGPGVQLNDSDLKFADLSDKNLIGASFEGSSLTSSRIIRTTLANANLSGADLSNALLQPTSLAGASLERVILKGATLNRPNGLRKEQFYSTNSYPAHDLQGVKLFFHDLSGWDFSGQDLSGAAFFIASLTNVDFSGATIKGTGFIGATDYGLTKGQIYSTASYQAKDLRGISFESVPIWFSAENDLSGWDFSGQNLSGANFHATNLSGANFSGASLVNGVFNRTPEEAHWAANLASTVLTAADARGATGMNLGGAITTNLIRPDGRIDSLDLSAGAALMAYAGVTIPVRLDANFTIAAGATFDLTDNAAIIDHAQSTTPAAVRAQILLGRGATGLGGKWRGTGITSSTAAAANQSQSDSRSLGYAENAAMPLGPCTTFHGAPVDETSILIAFTRTGDANLDGVVNDDDVTILGATYAPGVPGAAWALGDFDYNGFVDDDDVTLLAAFYDPSATALLSAPAEPGAGGVAAAPEPATVTLLCTMIAARGIIGMRRRRS